MNDDNVTSIITAETVGLDQLASFDSKGQAGPGVTFEIACKEVKRLTTDVEHLRVALKRSVVGLDDWINTFASELCNEKRVAEAYDRINAVGTLMYVAKIQEANREVLKLSEDNVAVQHHIACEYQVTGGLGKCDCGLDASVNKSL